MALPTRTLWRKHAKHTIDDMQTENNKNEGHRYQQLSYISSLWARVFTKQAHEQGLWVPSLSGMIKAGDEGLFLSALFTSLPGHPGELPLQALYEIFADDLRSRPTTERFAYSVEINSFLSSSKRVTSGPRRIQSVSRKSFSKSRVDASLKTQRISLDLSAAERGITRSISMKRPAPMLVHMRNGLPRKGEDTVAHKSWMKDMKIAESHHGIVGIKILSEELIALSILLGSPLTVDPQTGETSSKVGAFNISISSSVAEDGRHQVTLQKHKHSISQTLVRGSCSSSLFAKHLAAGSLPYSQNNKAVHSILINSHTLHSVQRGMSPSLHEYNFKTPQSKFISLLPSSRKSTFFIAGVSKEPPISNPLIGAISALPFVGGLVPLASASLIRTVQFIASGGLPPARLLQRLEGLVDKVNRHAPQISTFGSLYEHQNITRLYRERERLGKLATGASVTDNLAHKASRMQRYVALLERLMTLVPDMKPKDVITAVQDATSKHLELSYIDAVAAHKNNPSSASHIFDESQCGPDSDSHKKRLSSSTQSSANRSTRSSDASFSTFESPNPSAGNTQKSLGKQLETILKSELPFSVETVATVARMVLVAWTLSVEVVAWEDGEEGYRFPKFDQLPEKMILC
ncbi:hypothetical protein GQ44DRAFT_680364 [Phaeosphaeriaceae sp. PMI808]|nr:hypothetical protein GQ44DRAFT_680364 [Phaeosphaeriaceae sp. PMI808]